MNKYILILFIVISSTPQSVLFAQTVVETDTITNISTVGGLEKIEKGSTVKDEVSPLDITKNRGLYIITQDKKMQLRILGSMRFSTFYDNLEMPLKGTFSTYYIPNNDKKIINFHNSLSQTRMGFEVTRATLNHNIFIRIETDFDGVGNSFRIRHAYGQIGGFLVGKTWSLFSNVSDMPATVDKNGPTGAISPLNPQIRYGESYNNFSWAVGLEYSEPDIYQLNYDTLNVNYSTVQVIPDVTGRIGLHGEFGSIKLSFLLNSLSIKNTDLAVDNSLGYGASLSGKINIINRHKLYFQAAFGKSISHYMSVFSNTGQDAVYNSNTKEFENLYSMGSYITYGYDWNPKITTNASLGTARIYNLDFQTGDVYQNSVSASVDAFWRIIDGARIGVSYLYGRRTNKDNSTRSANRIWVLYYYDF